MRQKKIGRRLLALCLVTVLALAACGTSGGEQSEEVESPAEQEFVSDTEQPELEDEPPEPENPEPETSSAELSADGGSEATQASGTSDAASQQSAGENLFKLDPLGDYNLFAWDPQSMIYSDLGYAAWSEYGTGEDALVAAINAINALPTLQPGQAVEGAQAEGGFMTMAMDGTWAKTEYILRPNVLEVGGVTYALTQEQYSTLLQICKSSLSQGGQSAQWLVYMNPGRVVRIEMMDESGVMRDMKQDNLQIASGEPRHINVLNGGGTYTPGSRSFDGMFQARYHIDNGVVCTIATDGKTLYVECSDMSFACIYQVNEVGMSSWIRGNQEMIDGMANPRTGKPVIYLYPEQEQDVSVKLEFRGRVTYTWPEYANGWNVTASPDGTLKNRADGSIHYYLFWEGEPREENWDLSSGFVVRGSEINAFLQEKLPQLGLTPREYNDFITYWAPELKANAYNLITFAFEEYDELARLDISPAPDTVIRVHMVWRPLDGPVQIPEQQMPNVPKRSGFTVIEWGGTRLDMDDMQNGVVR